MRSPCLFTRQQPLKLGYFYWLRVKNSNPLLTELIISRCYLKHTKFYLEHKASSVVFTSKVSLVWFWCYDGSYLFQKYSSLHSRRLYSIRTVAIPGEILAR